MKPQNKNTKKYTIHIETLFESAHNLREYHGVPEPLHGHTWKAEVFAERCGLDHEDMAIDFLELRSALDTLIKPFEHKYINDIAPFDKINPSTENIATWIFEELKKKFEGHPAQIKRVRIWEGPQYSASVED